MLDSRTAEVVGEALARYPNLESVTRDRATCYAVAIKTGAPQAAAIADRFHIIKNLSDLIYMPIRKEFDGYWRKLVQQGELHPRAPVLTMGWLLERFYARIEGLGNSRQRKKLQRWKEVNRLHVKESLTIPQIAKRLHMKSALVRSAMETSWEENATPMQIELSRNIKRIAQAAVEAGVLDTGIIHAGLGGKVNKAWLADMLSPVRMEWEAMLKKHAGELKMPLSKWINAAMASGDGNIEQFAKGVLKDYRAIYNAIGKKYSNGLLEGTVCKIKCIKRIMYGRARFKLLYAKIVYKNTERCTTF